MNILSEIERDLKAFADPWSPVVVDASSAVWERNGKEVSVNFAASDSGAAFPDVIANGSRTSYKSFLAGPQMANLASFADFVVKTHALQARFIETDATISDDAGSANRRDPAVDLIRERANEDLPFMSTRVVLLRGEAGSGKTMLLREATARQATQFRHGKVSSLFFLVDAQGRALSRLEDAMARDLQDLRAGFSYSAVAPLARHNLVVPIIDGFDELLGSGGYDEAFSSLAAFLATLDGQGAVVASARSAFFDYRNFYDNASRFSADGRLNYQVETLQVEKWNEPQIREYVVAYSEGFGQGSDGFLERFDEITTRLEGSNKELLSKPFYASKVADLVFSGQSIKTDEDLLEQLVDAFVDREHRKLLDKDGHPLLSVKGHRAFLTSLAEEMWWQENRRLDVGTVQAAAELVTESFGLPSGAALAIVERVSSYAFLSSDGGSRRTLRFEHEVFYGYFLAHKLREYVESAPADLRRFLARSVVEPTLVDQLAKLIGSDSERCSRAIESVCAVLRPNVSEQVARENAGVVVAALFRSADKLRAGLTLKHLIVQQDLLGPVKGEAIAFVHCEFMGSDFSEVVLHRPTFEQCALRNVVVDMQSTRLEGLTSAAQDQFHGLQVKSAKEGYPSGRVFAPEDVRTVLTELGMEYGEKSASSAGTRSRAVLRRIDALDRFVRKMERRFYATQEDIAKFPFANSREWSEVFALLIRHHLIDEVYVQKSGPAIPLVRLAVPPDVLRRGENISDAATLPAVREFWTELLGT